MLQQDPGAVREKIARGCGRGARWELCLRGATGLEPSGHRLEAFCALYACTSRHIECIALCDVMYVSEVS